MLAVPGVALALDYSGRQNNEATFESLAQARANGPSAVAKLEGNNGRYVSHPVLDGYPDGTTWIYRSPNLYGGRAAAPRVSRRMSLEEARSMLGVDADATPEEIQAAYTRLMRLAHPDKGGTTGLATQLNAARDRLLKG